MSIGEHESFEEAAIRLGFAPNFVPIPDGVIHREKVEGDRAGKKSGWYVLFDGPVQVGVVGNWRTGLRENWREGGSGKFSRKDRLALKVAARDAAEVRRKEIEQERDAAAITANLIFNNAQPCSHHPYLETKGIQSHGIRQSIWHQGFRNSLTGERERDGNPALIIPMFDQYKRIRSIAAIAADGRKDFLAGGEKKGCYFMLGEPSSPLATIWIAEGFATAASVRESISEPVVVAFDAGNLHPVALVIRGLYPKARIVICADNDQFTPGNPGVTKATEAARAVGGLVVVPSF